MEIPEGEVVGIACGARVQLHGDDSLRVEARVDVPEPVEALDQEAGADQEHHGEGHLRNHQEAPDALALGPVGRRPSSSGELVLVGGAREQRVERHHQPHQEAAASVNAPVSQPSATFSRRGSPSGAKRTTAGIAQTPVTTASTPPSRARTRLSAST